MSYQNDLITHIFKFVTNCPNPNYKNIQMYIQKDLVIQQFKNTKLCKWLHFITEHSHVINFIMQNKSIYRGVKFKNNFPNTPVVNSLKSIYENNSFTIIDEIIRAKNPVNRSLGCIKFGNYYFIILIIDDNPCSIARAFYTRNKLPSNLV
jgi:hypothetical protein